MSGPSETRVSHPWTIASGTGGLSKDDVAVKKYGEATRSSSGSRALMSQPKLFTFGFQRKTSEDESAGKLGKPFTQSEDDEEWVGWVDWDALGGGSGDTA